MVGRNAGAYSAAITAYVHDGALDAYVYTASTTTIAKAPHGNSWYPFVHQDSMKLHSQPNPAKNETRSATPKNRSSRTHHLFEGVGVNGCQKEVRRSAELVA